MAIKTILRNYLFIFCLLASASAYGEKKQRIKTIWYYSPVPASYLYSDSLVFYYSGNRGSVFNPNRLNGVDYGFPYDAPLRYSNYPAVNLPPVLFDMNEIAAQYDSLHRYNFNFVKKMLYTTFKATYIQDTILTNFGAGTSPKGFSTEITVAHNNAMQPVTIYSTLYGNMSQQMDTMGIRNIYYDVEGKLVADSTFGANDKVFYNYVYDSYGRIETITEQRPLLTGMYNFTRTVYIYDGKGYLVQVHKQYFDEDVFVTLNKEVLEYDAAHHLTRHTVYESDNTIGYKREVTYDNNGDPYLHDVQYYSAGNLYSCELVEVYYNDYHNPDSAITWIDHCHIGHTQQTITRYTYETYEDGNDDDTSSVPPKRKPFIYPNPARNLVHIRWPKDFNKKPVEIKLYNATGQEMKRYTILKSAPVDDLDIEGLAAGIYMLRINTANRDYYYTAKLTVL